MTARTQRLFAVGAVVVVLALVGGLAWVGVRQVGLGGQVGDEDHIVPRLPVTVPDPADPWSGLYDAHGGVSARTMSDWVRYPAPTGYVWWDRKHRKLTLWVTGTDDDTFLDYGLAIETDSVRARRVRRFWITEPTIEEGEGANYTYGFMADRPLRWSALRVGESDAATAVSGDGTYLVTVTRTAPAVWGVDVVVQEGAPAAHAHEVEMTIAADRPDPPWHTITIDLRTQLVDGEREWHVELDRVGP